jgi:hypothetical protein
MATTKSSTYPQRIHVIVHGRVHRLVQATIQSRAAPWTNLDLTGSLMDASWMHHGQLVDYTMYATKASNNGPIGLQSLQCTLLTTMCSSTHASLPSHGAAHRPPPSHQHQTPASCHTTQAIIRSVYAQQWAAHPCTHLVTLHRQQYTTTVKCTKLSTQHGNLQILTALPFDKVKAQNPSTTSRT